MASVPEPDRIPTRAERKMMKRESRKAIFEQLSAKAQEVMVLPARPGSNLKLVRRFYHSRAQMRAMARIQTDMMWKELRRLAREEGEEGVEQKSIDVGNSSDTPITCPPGDPTLSGQTPRLDDGGEPAALAQ